MGFNRFQINCLIRIILIGFFMVTAIVLLGKEFTLLSFGSLLITIICFLNLLRYVQITTREMTRFLQSIEFSDLSISFPENKYGGIFDEFFFSLKKTAEGFKKIRADKEGNAHYLQTVIKHVGTGLISYNNINGNIELLNSSAKKMLKISSINNIKQLEFWEKLENMKHGEKKMITTEEKKQLSVHTTGFSLQGKTITMVAFQDIGHELEREKMQNELNIAKKVQQSLFPVKQPIENKIDIAGTCIPAHETGGDYYDWITDKDKLFIMVGDVSGKGLAASIYMTLCKGIFQSLKEMNLSPLKIIKKANTILYNTMDKNQFISLFLCTYSYEDSILNYVRAGHNPPLLYSKESDSFIELNGKGMALGLTKGKVFDDFIEEKQLYLKKGDVLILYTDGVTEMMNENKDEFGLKQLKKIISKCKNENANKIINNIHKKIEQFAGKADQHDDITIVVVKMS